MTLTVCVGSSGSGKTTFLDDVYKVHRCIYIRQYHRMRPYIVVKDIPHFDETQLPFWDTYVREGKADSIQAGGYLGGHFTQGLSGGQRKLLLFEIICQRTLKIEKLKDLLIVLDEPFSGVTDDFIPFITERLQRLKEPHNILLVTNDHVAKLSDMADNVITVTAIDRSVVQINHLPEPVNRDKAIMALAVGDKYTNPDHHSTIMADLRFFWTVEVKSNAALTEIAITALSYFVLFVATFWNTNDDSAVLILIAGSIIAFFIVNPYLLSLVDWRNMMLEEAEALVHASKSHYKGLKMALTLTLILCTSVCEFAVINIVTKGDLFFRFRYWFAMLCDNASMALPQVCLGVFTELPFQTAAILGGMPFLLMIFLSTTFSPGSGIPVLKELRYLFARYYFWCMVPEIQDSMEGCPNEDKWIIVCLLVSAFAILSIIFTLIGLFHTRQKTTAKKQNQTRWANMSTDREYQALQLELYGRSQHCEDDHDSKPVESSTTDDKRNPDDQPCDGAAGKRDKQENKTGGLPESPLPVAST